MDTPCAENPTRCTLSFRVFVWGLQLSCYSKLGTCGVSGRCCWGRTCHDTDASSPAQPLCSYRSHQRSPRKSSSALKLRPPASRVSLRVARSHLAWHSRGMLPVLSSAGAVSSRSRRQRPCAPASSKTMLAICMCVSRLRGWAPLGRIHCRYGALAHQRLGPRTSPRNPPGWTERLPPFTSSYDSTDSHVLSSQLSSPRTSSAAWPTMLGHPLSPMSSRHSYAPPTAARLQSAAWATSPTRPRTPCSPRTPRTLQVWLGDLGDQPWHGRSDKARLRSHVSRASRSSTHSGPQSSRSSLPYVLV